MSSIKVVDLFAGPGGLGEGFLSLDNTYSNVVSAEMTSAARKTLRLRAYFRMLRDHRPDCLRDYYAYCNGTSDKPWTFQTDDLWEEAGEEARQITLGSDGGNHELNTRIKAANLNQKDWVLIGGPPCQAYSLVGRARNKGIADYKAEEDHRHFLYKEYLKIIQQHSPAVFVMENVKGILSSRVAGRRVFHDILTDLSFPDKALSIKGNGTRYRICSLVTGDTFHHGDDPAEFDARKFVIRAENYGIPQARHRVILLGIREDIDVTPGTLQLVTEKAHVSSVLEALPRLRSKVTKQKDSALEWKTLVKDHIDDLRAAAAHSPDKRMRELIRPLEDAKSAIDDLEDVGALRYKRQTEENPQISALDDWYQDPELQVWLNHEARGHMSDDLRRYIYAACFTEARGYSPKGHRDFPLPHLSPDHKNWESGKFADRFRVQAANNPSTTVTSHISKDGHYFIHPDPSQCRSLTVREAARLQTFPDNYFFEGNRTEQFHQVGNAVPPLLARKIALIVKGVIETHEENTRGQKSLPGFEALNTKVTDDRCPQPCDPQPEYGCDSW